MIYLIWALPALMVAGSILSGRVGLATAALLGLLVAIGAGLAAGLAPFGVAQTGNALLRGAWIGVTIAPYILGGLLFWKIGARRFQHDGEEPGAASAATAAGSTPATDTLRLRHRLFFACFLVGPFAESATGFGVGMIGTVLLLRGRVADPRHLAIFALLSQTMIPWGAMGSGTVLAAAYIRVTPTELALNAVIPMALLMPVWLTIYWRTARQAGLGARWTVALAELAWLAAGLLCLTLATRYLGPEVALLAAFGPLIVLRYWRDARPTPAQWRAALVKALPFVLVIGGLAAARLVPALREALTGIWVLAPYADLPRFAPLYHAGMWFLAAALVTAALHGRAASLPGEIASAWRTGRQAVLTVLLFAMMAEVMSASGVSGALAQQLFAALRENVVLLTPTLSGALGILTNSGNAPNSLFLPSLLAIAAQSGMSVAAIAAVQHVSGMSLGLFSPVRMAIAADLAQARGMERQLYRCLLPYALAGFVLMTLAALAVVGMAAMAG